MAEGKKLRLNKVLRELNISLDRAVEHLAKNGYDVEARPTTKISDNEYQILEPKLHLLKAMLQYMQIHMII